MTLLWRKPKTRRIEIQGSTAEGGNDNLNIESLLESNRESDIAGGRNQYQSYESQVRETYRKYNGVADWGCQPLRAAVDIRTSFIAGEGPSITAEDPRTQEWIKLFIDENRMFSSRFFDLVLGGEMVGKSLVYIKANPGGMPRLIRIPWVVDKPWKVTTTDKWDLENIDGVMIQTDHGWEPLSVNFFTYFRLGGDDWELNRTVTRHGVVLGEYENYDRAMKDLRLNNHVSARITPNLQTGTDEETKQAVKDFKDTRWKIGKMRIGTGTFTYETPGMGAAENLKSEMATALKTIAGVTGIPVHWIGWADLMNNRATADSLYETMNNATTRERAIYEDGMRDLIIKAQEVYINTGGTLISRVDHTVAVTIPIVDRSKFLDLVKGLSMAYADEAISMADYRAALPGINPTETERQQRTEEKIDSLELTTATKQIPKIEIVNDEEEGGDDGQKERVG